MIPRSISHQLGKLRSRENTLRLCWGIARCLAVIIPFLILACAIDYFIDRMGYEETPLFVRVLLFFTQLGVAAGVAFWWIVWPMVRQPSENDLALYVEEKMPGFHHRLISTVQLNQPGARKEGMSQELIDVVTRETEKQAEQAAFAGLADQRRFVWSAGLGGSVLLIGVVLLILVPLAPVLLARQLPWNDVELPRSVRLENITREIWPVGESVVLKFKVTGKPLEAYLQARKEGQKHALLDALDEIRGLEGHALVQTDGEPNEKYELKFVRLLKDGDEGALFEAGMPSRDMDFSVTAKLGDGRTRKASTITFVSRPSVIDKEIKAWVQLPPSCGLRPGDKRYEMPPTGGDIKAIPDCNARVEIKLYKPVKVASLILVSRPPPADVAAKLMAETLPFLGIWEGPLKNALIKNLSASAPRSVPLTLSADRKTARGEFELHPLLKEYRIEVADENQFKNNPPTTRSIEFVSEARPTVALLPTMMLPPGRIFYTETDILEGMPVPEGEAIPIAYTCSGPYGLDHAKLRYSYPKKRESGEAPLEEEVWEFLDLLPKNPGKNTGPFVQRIGRFLNTEETSFHAIPGDPNKPELLGRLEGGGNFMFQTSNLRSKGKDITLKPGDQIAYYVEVFAGTPESGRPSARSEIRVVNVVSLGDLAKWHKERLDEHTRIKKILDDQKKNTPASQ